MFKNSKKSKFFTAYSVHVGEFLPHTQYTLHNFYRILRRRGIIFTVNISLTLYTNSFYGSVLVSPIQMGSLSVNNSVTKISRLGTFKLKSHTVYSLLGIMNCQAAVVNALFFFRQAIPRKHV
jgi:hypothetical protein